MSILTILQNFVKLACLKVAFPKIVIFGIFVCNLETRPDMLISVLILYLLMSTNMWKKFHSRSFRSFRDLSGLFPSPDAIKADAIDRWYQTPKDLWRGAQPLYDLSIFLTSLFRLENMFFTSVIKIIQWSLHNSNLYNSNVSLTRANSLAPRKFPDKLL